MTEVKATVNGRHYRIEAHGHAGSSTVCNAVSALLYALEGALVNHDSAVCHFSRLQPGDAEIECIAQDDLPAEDFRCILIGLMQIELAHPDEIKINQNLFQ